MAIKITRSELLARSRSIRTLTAGVIGGGVQTVLGNIGVGAVFDIPAGKRMCIWKITATVSGVGVGAEAVQVSTDVAAGVVENIIHAQYGFGTTDSDTLEVGGDVKSPILVIPNQTPAAGASANVSVGLCSVAAPLDVVIDYYLLP